MTFLMSSSELQDGEQGGFLGLSGKWLELNLSGGYISLEGCSLLTHRKSNDKKSTFLKTSFIEV